MPVVRRCLSLLLVVSSPVAAQTASTEHPAAASAREAEGTHTLPLLFGVAGGALSYQGGRQEQALGVVVRWVATPWLSLSTTPTSARVREPSAVTAGTLQTSSGLVDLPIDATLSHAFQAPWSPGVA